MKLDRYYTYSAFEKVLFEILENHTQLGIEKKLLGRSVLGRSIYGIELGTGEQRILIWSQMHGNESSTTRALLGCLDSGDFSDFLLQVKLYIIPVLNPDGAEAWTRVNANQVDLNRDAIEQSQVETQILMKCYREFKPHYCLNLHGQRTIYGNEQGSQPAQISFLAPAGDPERMVSPVRLKSMQLINAMVQGLNMDEGAYIGRYSDAFNLNCVGDYFTHHGTPTVLFEAGHAAADYSRENVVSYMTNALKIAISHIALQSYELFTADMDQTILESYLKIPSIHKNYCDILIKNMVSENGKPVDLSIMYHEEVHDGVLFFIPCVVGVNDQEVKNGHRVIDLLDIPTENYDFEISASGVILSTTFEIAIFCE